jgi:hypothetical protein
MYSSTNHILKCTSKSNWSMLHMLLHVVWYVRIHLQHEWVCDINVTDFKWKMDGENSLVNQNTSGTE